MRGRPRVGWVGLVVAMLGAGASTRAGAPDPGAVERGRVALTTKSHLPPEWPLEAYARAGKFWGEPAPDPEADPKGFAEAFNARYGLHPAPYPNDGLPMGLRRATDPKTGKVGLQVDCLLCHGGSIGGTSYVGLGNTQLDTSLLFDDLARASGRPILPSTIFNFGNVRGLNNAGQFDVFLLNMRNADLSRRALPLPTGAKLPELDTPPWWNLGKKATKYYDGRTDARAARSNMQFFLGAFSLQQFRELEPTFDDIDAYLKSLKAPKYPFPIDAERADRGRAAFTKTCAKCHGTYGPDGSYPSKIVPLDVVGTDPARSKGLTSKFIEHYNATWFGEDYPVAEEAIGYQAPPLDGIWASAPYLHNGSVPTLHALLRSTERPARFRRPSSTDFAYYDRENVGWKVETVDEPVSPGTPHVEARWIYDTARWGLGNGGHTFGDKLAEDERLDLIEYLKTL